MNEGKENIPHVTSKNSSPLARRGMGLFMRVSGEAPGDTYAQAALIAEYCTARGLSPQEMSAALLKNEIALGTIVRTANRIHEKRNVKAVAPVNLYSAEWQVRDDFTVAARLQGNDALIQHYLARARRPAQRRPS